MNVWRNEQGSVGTVLLLILIPLVLIGIVLTTEHPRLVHGSDIDLQQAVVDATRAAAMCVNEASQAHGTPRINPDRAHEVFRRILASNLQLHEITLEPLTHSGVREAPSYVLVVYNGDDLFTPGAKAYYLSDSFSQELLPFDGLPKTFSVNSDGITYESDGRAVTFNEPGCIAFVKSPLKPAISNRTPDANRWAAATIKTNF
ncbi:MAG: hypothetical protein C4575_01910 [Desulforudis sp.]|nr:MAG: hypothetical protein C4575_01910 [Desulforudis sp.]